MNGEQTSGGKLEQPQAPMAGAAGDARQRPGQPQPGPAARLARAAYWVALGLTAVVLSTRPVVLGLRPVVPTLHAPAFQSAALQVAASELASAVVPQQSAVLKRQFFQSSPAAPSVHASTLALLPSGDLVAAWFGGSREGAKDVAIYASNWDAAEGQWETPRILSDRAQSSEELGRYVKKLGNPVLHGDADGRLWLYYVTVSVGGVERWFDQRQAFRRRGANLERCAAFDHGAVSEHQQPRPLPADRACRWRCAAAHLP